MRQFFLAAVAAVCVASAAPALSQTASCAATVSDIVFGEVYVRDALTAQTIGDVEISCQGGPSLGAMRACLFIGPGSGGASDGNRYMRRFDGESLAYQLSAHGHGGAAWNVEEFAISLDATGVGAVTAAIYGEILSSGSTVGGGDYGATFTGSDLSLTFGEASCQGGGSSEPGGFVVTATVAPSCTVSVGAMAFGDVGASLATGASASAAIDVTCTDGAPFSVALGAGLGAGVTNPEGRRMSSGSDTLVYGLYQDPAGSQPWGWTLQGNDVAATGTGFAQRFITHGIIHAGQTVLAGEYFDSVVVTIHY